MRTEQARAQPSESQVVAWQSLWRLIAERIVASEVIACCHCQPNELLPGEPRTAEEASIGQCPSCGAELRPDDMIGCGVLLRRGGGPHA